MPTAKPSPTLEERIRARAHEIWVQEGRPEGQHVAHWRRAEAEIAAEAKPATPRRRPASPRPRKAAVR